MIYCILKVMTKKMNSIEVQHLDFNFSNLNFTTSSLLPVSGCFAVIKQSLHLRYMISKQRYSRLSKGNTEVASKHIQAKFTQRADDSAALFVFMTQQVEK